MAAAKFQSKQKNYGTRSRPSTSTERLKVGISLIYITSFLGAFCSEAANLPEAQRWTNKKKASLGMSGVLWRCACVWDALWKDEVLELYVF